MPSSPPNEVFPTHSPLTVELWNRLLAYGRRSASPAGQAAPCRWARSRTPMRGARTAAAGGRCASSTRALWPPGWGLDPLRRDRRRASGRRSPADSSSTGSNRICFDAGLAGVLFPRALRRRASLGIVARGDGGCGPAIHGRGHRADPAPARVRDEKRARYYLAVDDGESRTIRAWRSNPRHYLELDQCETSPSPSRGTSFARAGSSRDGLATRLGAR